jgi:hypothetical protein
VNVRRSLAVAAISLLALSLECVAADPPGDARATPGSVVPSTGTTAIPAEKVERPASATSAARPAKSAGSLNGPTTADCAALRKRYAESQACFAPYRLANGGIKPEAAKHCREVADPALKCGPATASP